MSARKPAPLKHLSPMVRAFITAYVEDPQHHITNAAIKAGYSPKSAQQQGSMLLAQPIVKEEVERRLKRIEEKAEVTVAEVIRELKHIGFADIRRAYSDQGLLLNPKDMPEDIARAVQAVDSEEIFEFENREKRHIGDTVKLRMNPKVAALELIGRYLKMFTDRVELTADEGIFERLERARERVKKAKR